MTDYNKAILDRALREYAEAVKNKDAKFITLDEHDEIHFKGIPLGLYAKRDKTTKH